ncbi:MAG: molybdate ABC transporter substrate-binding protein [Myxococcaceae bacterium]
MRTVFGAVAALLLAGCKPSAAPSSEAKVETKSLKVAAASDLAFAFKEVGAAFEKKTGHKVEFSFGSTGQMAKQLREGAPFDVFAAANASFVDDVVKAGGCDGETKSMYARGRIVVWTKNGDAAAPATLKDLTDARFVKIAIANPEHAPYGMAAKQAMESAGLWDALQPKLVFGENIQQTLQFAQTGNAEAAFAALSLALVAEGGTYLLVDETLHKPIDQAMVVCKGGAVGKQFTAFVGSVEGREMMKRYGFLLPGEQMVRKE